MAIIYQKNKASGKTYAFDSRSYWVPELQQPRSERKYLGVVDDATGEIIPSSGKRGRKPGTSVKKKKSQESEPDQSAAIIAQKEQEIRELKAEVRRLQKYIQQISDTAAKALKN